MKETKSSNPAVPHCSKLPSSGEDQDSIATPSSNTVNFDRPPPEKANGYPLRGDLCRAKIFYTDGIRFKERFALVVGRHGPDFILVPLTSRAPRSEFDINLEGWSEAGLPGPGTARCWKLTPVDRSLIVRFVGHVAHTDWQRVVGSLNCWFDTLVA